ncbi:GNAT family N-acetyltransferase [Neobacillus niacini]|uniref:GNAT family N-acetyltransferase n=1 Tax=Neobacillus niacini TaxID=86668 RepID=UPI0021CB0F59|nr:GNAT family N-acetyltransferase [Neobacillus niacini]MCM3766970.1 GNAT family N-acetyltransferase [Neobacillus niacini]
MTNKTCVYPELETERLQLRILTLDDAEKVMAHFSDPAVTRFMDIEPCKDLKDVEEIIQYHIEDSGCRWGIFYKEQFVGTIGFHYLRKNEGDFIAEIGFDLSKKYWSKGFMTEAIREVISFGFTQMGLTMIDATVEPDNEKSINLMKRLEFKRAEELQDHLVYFYLKN